MQRNGFKKFIWDDKKEKINIEKHQVSFSIAQEAFCDLRRIIATDEEHSESEERFFRIGSTSIGICTVRFVFREDVIRIFGAKEESFMKKKTIKPIGKLTKVNDFLPSPDELLASVSTKKVTISLDEKTIEFFKKQASKNDKKYQQMIREVLRIYAEKFKNVS